MTIVVGITSSAESAAVIDAALTEQRLRGSKLVLVNTTRGDAYLDQHFLSDTDRASLEERLQAAGSNFLIQQSVSGRDPAEEIVADADEHDAELVVIGLRKRSPVGKLLMGSTAQAVLLNASMPVLAVKTR